MSSSKACLVHYEFIYIDFKNIAKGLVDEALSLSW